MAVYQTGRHRGLAVLVRSYKIQGSIGQQRPSATERGIDHANQRRQL